MKKILLSLLVAATVVASGASAYASTATTTMNVSATVAAAVTVSATDLNFGNMLVGNNFIESNSTITVTAPNGMPYAISLDRGQYYDGNWRAMVSGNNVIEYGLYKPSGPEWGDSDFANSYLRGSSVPDTGTGVAQSFTVYGKTFSPAPSPGSYLDVVTVTVNY